MGFGQRWTSGTYDEHHTSLGFGFQRQRCLGFLHWWWFVFRGRWFKKYLYTSLCCFYYSLTFFPEPEIYSRMPRTLTTTINDHVSKPHGARDHYGARCAGQVAARKNNACGVGIAYDSKATGIRILGGRITTTDKATALTYGYDKVGLSCVLRKLFYIPSNLHFAESLWLMKNIGCSPDVTDVKRPPVITLDPLSYAVLQKDLKTTGEARVFQNIYILRGSTSVALAWDDCHWAHVLVQSFTVSSISKLIIIIEPWLLTARRYYSFRIDIVSGKSVS